jgi:hypothetical protein
MARVMIAKCAEAIALRKGWPDDLANLYEESEIDRTQVLDLMPSEIIDKTEAEAKIELIGGKNTLTVDWCDAGDLGRVPEGQFFDKTLRWAREEAKDADTLEHWMKRNKLARAEMKAKHGKDYLEWMGEMERIMTARQQAEAKAQVIEGEGQ